MPAHDAVAGMLTFSGSALLASHGGGDGGDRGGGKGGGRGELLTHWHALNLVVVARIADTQTGKTPPTSG